MLIDYIQRTYAERCRRNPQYSLRAFAKSLDIDSSTLSALIRRKRPLTEKTARRLIGSLGIADTLRAQELLREARSERERPAPEYENTELAKAAVMGSWEHSAIRSLLQLEGYRPNTKQIARRLNIPHGIALEALNRMARLGLVAQQGDTWLDTGKSLDLSGKEERPRGTLRQYVAKAIESLDKDPFESIDISGATVSISSRRIAEARELIRDFHRRICALLEDGRKDAVYRVNVQLFPLSMSEDTPGTNGTAVFS